VLVCSKGRGGQLGAWKRVRHDGARNVLVRLLPGAHTAVKDVRGLRRRRKPPSRARSRGPGRPSRTCSRSLQRRTKFVVLAFELSGPTVQKLVNVWEQRASRILGPDRR
jgi:hypothetical protein